MFTLVGMSTNTPLFVVVVMSVVVVVVVAMRVVVVVVSYPAYRPVPLGHVSPSIPHHLFLFVCLFVCLIVV